MRLHDSLLVRSLALAVFGVTVALVATSTLGACGTAKAPIAPVAVSDAGANDAAVEARPVEHPFAGNSGEATQLIGAAVDQKSPEVNKCISEYRVRKKLPHERVEVSVGIDQEGKLLGAALKNRAADPTLSECITKALVNAPFPRSHAGVIQIVKSFEEIAQ